MLYMGYGQVHLNCQHLNHLTPFGHLAAQSADSSFDHPLRSLSVSAASAIVITSPL